MIAPPAIILLFAMQCPPGPTCTTLPLHGFGTWAACQDARDDAKADTDVIAVCIRRGTPHSE